MSNELCKCGKVGNISCPNDERCGAVDKQLSTEERIKADAAARYPATDEGVLMAAGYIAGATAVHERAQTALVEIEKVHKMYHDLKGDNPAANHILNIAREYLQQWKEGKGSSQTEAKEGVIRLILAGAAEVSKDAISAEEYLKSEGVDVTEIKANAQYFTWKAELIRITKEKTGEPVVKINDIEAVKWYNDGFTPEQTFRETWQSDGD